MKRVLILIFLLTGMVISIQCSSKEFQKNSNQLTSDGHWQLIQLHGKPIIKGSSITLRFKEDEAFGSGGCNGYSSKYELGEKKITFKELMWTSMACSKPEGVLDQEAKYMKALSNTMFYQLEDRQLSLLDKTKKTLLKYEFIKKVRVKYQLEGNTWKLNSFILGQLASSAVQGQNYMITFSNGTIKGQTACKRFTASYQLDDGKIEITDLKVQGSPCSENYQEDQEKEFFNILKSVHSYKIEEDRLRLFSKNDAALDLSIKQ